MNIKFLFINKYLQFDELCGKICFGFLTKVSKGFLKKEKKKS